MKYNAQKNIKAEQLEKVKMTFEDVYKNSKQVSKQQNVDIAYDTLAKAKNNIDRETVTQIADNLDIQIKNDSHIVDNPEIKSKAGNNKNPKIVNIDKIFENVDNKNAKDFRKNAIEKALSLFRNKQVTIKDTKTLTEINKSGIDKTFSGNVTTEKIQSTNNIDSIIEEGIYKYTTESYENNDGILFHHFFTPIRYDGQNGLIRVVVKEFTHNRTMNDKYYYHQLEFINNKRMKKENNSTLPHESGSKARELSSVENNIP